MHMLPLFFVCICLYTINGAVIAFDPTKEVDCLSENGGCAFNNASIWINNTIPSTNDSVVITGSGASSSPLLLVFPAGYGVELKSLEVESANVALNNGSALEADVLELSSTASFSLLTGGSLQALGDDSNFTLSSTAKLHVQGTMDWSGTLLIYGQVELSAGASVSWGNATYAPVLASIETQINSMYLLIPPNVNVSFPYGLVVALEVAMAGNCSATVNKLFVFGDIQDRIAGKLILAANTSLNLHNVSAFITSSNGTYGTGNITITDSQVNFENTVVTAFNGSVSVSGVSVAQFEGYNIRNLHLGSESDSVSIVAHDLGVTGIADGFGTLAVQGTGLNISGLFAIDGSIQASNSRIAIAQTGYLVISPSCVLDIDNGTMLLAGNIKGDVNIPQTAILNTTYANSTIQGNVINKGILHVAENRVLLIHGNFTQTITGTLQVDLVNTNTSAVNITNATVSIAGDLKYRITKKPFLHSAKFPILVAINSKLTGNFNNDTATALESSIVHRDLHLETEGSIIYIKYDFTVKDVAAWEWAVIAVVCGLFIAIAVTCIVKFRANRKYEPIPDAQ